MASCIFSYLLSEPELEIEALPCRRMFGKYHLCTDARTPLMYARSEQRECVVFGLAIHVITGESAQIAENIVSGCARISDVLDFEKHLGGKYLILFREGENYFILGDATCSVPIFYHTAGSCMVASHLQFIVHQNHDLPDSRLLNIRRSGDISQAMPFDITEYQDIKQLIPNHYLSVNDQTAVRFINFEKPQPIISAEKAAALTAPMIDTLCRFYLNTFPVYCPITAGRDSRVVLSFLASHHPSVACYTIRHPEHRAETQDLIIPKQLCGAAHFSYQQFNDVFVPEKVQAEMDRFLGKDKYSFRTLRIAQTINEHFSDGAIINGDIIGQVGKCSLHRDIPLRFATPAYFRCKLHNYSRDSKTQLKQWLADIRKGGEQVNPLDLFSIENRLGRWAAQENLIYNTLGQVYLNLFNSRSIIYLWTAVSRKERKESAIHMHLIREKMPQLLKFPFESDDSFLIRLSKTNGLTYLLASYLKYYIQRRQFNRGSSYEKNHCDSR